MRKLIAAAAALSILAGCSQADSDAAEDEDVAEADAEEGDDGEDESAESESEQAMLANGAPAYPGMDVSAAAVRPPSGESQSVSFESGADMFDVAEFYRNYYSNQDYDISSMSLATTGTEDGGTVSVSLNGRTGGSRVSVMPRDEGGEFDLSKEYGSNFPSYPGVAADDVNVHQFENGRRSLRFETADAPLDVITYYRQRLGQNYELRSISVNARSRVYRRSASVLASSRYNATGSRVSITTRDPERAAQAGGK